MKSEKANKILKQNRFENGKYSPMSELVTIKKELFLKLAELAEQAFEWSSITTIPKNVTAETELLLKADNGSHWIGHYINDKFKVIGNNQLRFIGWKYIND